MSTDERENDPTEQAYRAKTHKIVTGTINLAASAGLAEPEQKQRGGVRPRVKNRWRNQPCKCGSGKKAKRCCLPMLARAYK